MMEQEFDLTPEKRQRRLFWLLSGCGVLLVILLCAGVTIATTNLLFQGAQDGPADADVLDIVGEALVGAGPGSVGRGRIGYVDSVGKIGTVAPDGGGRRILANGDERRYQFPTWSPHGARLATVGADQSGGGVYLFSDQPSAGGRDSEELYYSRTEDPFYLFWSPDGQQISFLANHPDGIGLRLAPVNGGVDSRLLATGSPFYWDWSLGGDELFYHTGLASTDARLAFLDIGSDESGADVGRPGYFQAPGISAGERYLAYAEVDEAGGRSLVVQDREQGDLQQVPHLGMVALGWNPAGHELAFISPGSANPLDTGYFGPLRLLDATSGQVQTLTEEVVLAFFWAPDGHALAYLTVADPREELTAYRAEANETMSRLGKQTLQREAPLRLNLWVTEVAASETKLLLSFEPTRIYLEQFLPFFDQYALSHRIWSPDSTELVLPLMVDESARIYVVPLSGEPRQIADGVIAFWSLR